MTFPKDNESSVYYHDDNPNDPFVTDHQRTSTDADWWPCYSCDCSDSLEQHCRCSCHSQRRHH